MLVHNVGRDLRIGLRILIKEKAFSAVAALVTLVALVATLVPARRATRVDPMTALRSE